MTINSQGEEADRFKTCERCGMDYRPDIENHVCRINPIFAATYINPPNFDGLVDKDILDRFKGATVNWGDIINAQLIKTNKELIEAMRSK